MKGGQIESPPPENTFNKPSLIRVKTNSTLDYIVFYFL